MDGLKIDIWENIVKKVNFNAFPIRKSSIWVFISFYFFYVYIYIDSDTDIDIDIHVHIHIHIHFYIHFRIFHIYFICPYLSLFFRKKKAFLH